MSPLPVLQASSYRVDLGQRQDTMGQTWGWWVASSKAVFFFVLSSSPTVWHQFISRCLSLTSCLSFEECMGEGGVCPWICVHTLSHLSFYVFLRNCRFFLPVWQRWCVAYCLLQTGCLKVFQRFVLKLQQLIWNLWSVLGSPERWVKTLNKHVWQRSSYDQLQTSDQGKWRGFNSSLP